MSSHSQTTVDPADDGSAAAAPVEVDVLVLAWAAGAPGRAGEVAFPALDGRRSVLGRGDDDSPDEPRLRFFRQRPGVLEGTGPLASPGLSRRQLTFRATADGIAVERVGRCALEINGVRHDEAVVRHGDVLVVPRELVLACVRRPTTMLAARQFPPGAAAAFGEADSLGIIGESHAVWTLREATAFAAQTDAHVLLLGESGTGKELVARAVHELSGAGRRPFVARNASTLPAGLIDAELFGNARNYPNAGMPERAGLVGDADGGTLFLDEIGELPLELQAHLLRVLDQGGEYQRLGDGTTRRSSFRLVAATNRGLGALKHDLAARFTATIEVPALDRRREDLPLLARALVLRAAQRSPHLAGRFVTTAGARLEARLGSALVADLLGRSWETNVRELDAVLWKAIAASPGDVLELARAHGSTPEPPRSSPRGELLRDDVRAALDGAGGNVTHAARALGLSSRFALYRLMRKYALDGEVEVPGAPDRRTRG